MEWSHACSLSAGMQITKDMGVLLYILMMATFSADGRETAWSDYGLITSGKGSHFEAYNLNAKKDALLS